MRKRLTLLLLFIFSLLPQFLHAQCGTTVELGPDITLCEPGGTVQLQGLINGPYDFFEWTPTTGLSNPNSLAPTASVFSTIDYVLSAYGQSGNNLIINGDFESGIAGITSDYVHSPTNLVPEGTYAVIQSPSLVHSNFPPCDDHTFGDGTGHMMAVNGAGIANQNIWCQTVPVNPNTYYNFSAWVMTIIPVAPAQLQFSVNGQLLGNIFNANSTPCLWQPFAETWFSGGNTSATICIVNQNTALFGNDFALDDIAFYEYCEASDTITIEVLPNAMVNVEEYLCQGDCYNIGSTSYCNTGFYSQTINSVNGCDSTINLQLTVLNPIANIEAPEPLSCYNNFVTTLNASFSSFTPWTSYAWTGPNGFTSSLQNPTVTQPGTYTLTVTEAAGNASCSATASVTVDYFGDFPIANAGPGQFLTCQDPNAQLDGSNSSSGGDITYTWSGPAGFSSDTISPEVMAPGVYNLTVTNTLSGCTATDLVLVEADIDTPSVLALADTLSCADTLATLSGNVDSTIQTFLWSGPAGFSDSTLTTQAGLPGEYVLQVLGPNGCPGADTVMLTTDTLSPSFSLQGTTLSCAQGNDTIRLSPNTAYDTLFWSGPGGFVSSEPEPEVNSWGWYEVMVVGENGCVGLDSVEVAADTLSPGVSAVGAVIDCQNTAVTISGSSPDTILSWMWGGPGGFTGSGDTVQVTEAGSYTLTVTGLNGCTSSTQAVVTPSSDIPDLSAAGGTITCAESEVILAAQSQAAQSISWSGPGGFSSDQFSVNVDVPGAYTAQVIAANGCQNDTTVMVGIDTLAPPLSMSGGTLTCAEPELLLIPQTDSTAQSYAWQGPGGFSSGDTLVLATLPGAYQLTLTAANGCQTTAAAAVDQDTVAPSAQLSAPPITCLDPVVDITAQVTAAQPGYSWSGPGGFNSLEAEPELMLPGDYTLNLLDSLNGCQSQLLLTVSADTLPPLISGQGDTLTCVEPQVNLQSTASGAPLQWFWSGPGGFFADQPDPQVSTPGLYQLEVQGENGCWDSLTVNVDIDTLAPDLDATGGTITCADPVVTLQALSQAAESFGWSGPGGFNATTAQADAALPGDYQLTATGANGCTSTLSLNVPADTLSPQVSAAGGEISCDSTSISLTGNTDTPQGQILWTGPGGFSADNLTPSASQPGEYLLTVTAANGCVGSDTALVTADEDIPDVSASGGTITCDQPALQLQGSSVTQGVSYAWSGPAGFQSAEPSPTVTIGGTYTLTVTAANGCSATAGATVLVDTVSPDISIAPLHLDCYNSQLFMDAEVTGVGLQNLEWTGPNGFASNELEPFISQPGQYTLTATGLNGCRSVAGITVSQDTTSPQFQLSTSNILNCYNPEAELQASVLGSGNFTFNWTDEQQAPLSDELTFSTTQSGWYTFTIQNVDNGCVSSDSIELQADFSPAQAAAQAENSGVLSCDFTSLTLSAQGSAPAGGINYSWQTPSGQTLGSQSELAVTAPGDYVLVVQNQQSGCRDTLSLPVIIDQSPPTLSIALPGLLTCAQTTLMLDASASSAGPEFQYSWTAQPGEILSGAAGPKPTIAQAGVYQLLITDTSNGCTDSLTVEVQADIQPPQVQTEVQGELNCVTEAVELSGAGSSAGPGFSYSWSALSGTLSGNPQALSVQATAAGSYVLTVQNTDNGCTTSDTVQVLENLNVPTGLNVSIDAPYCPGEPGALIVESVEGGTEPYVYSINGQIFTPQNLFPNLPPDDYTVYVEDAIGCVDSTSVNIPEPVGPQVTLPEAINMRFSETEQLIPELNFPESLIDSLTWWPTDFLSCTDCLRPFLELPKHTLTYRLTIFTTEGCSTEGEVLVRVNRQRNIFIPNAFSPGNQDGRNDFLTVYGPAEEIQSIRRFLVFDRWGEQVFEARNFQPNDPTAGWDGRHRGEFMDPGVFVYFTEVEFVDGVVELFEGDVTLVR